MFRLWLNGFCSRFRMTIILLSFVFLWIAALTPFAVLDFLLARCCRGLRCAAIHFALAPRVSPVRKSAAMTSCIHFSPRHCEERILAGLNEVNAPCGVGRWNGEIRRISKWNASPIEEFRNGMQARRNAKIQDSETTKQSSQPALHVMIIFIM